MKRNKKVLFVSHCLLNQNAMAVGKEKYTGSVKDLLEVFAEAGVGIVQLDCPQLEFNNGLNRRPATKNSTNGYRDDCKKLSSKVMKKIEQYLRNDYKVLGILGVEFSQTCGVHRIQNGKRNVPGKGIFMEELEAEMQKKNFQVPLVGVNLNNIFSSIEKIQSLLSFS
jgi:predicted secreted protein